MRANGPQRRRARASVLTVALLLAQVAGFFALLPLVAQAAPAICAVPGGDGPPAAPLTGIVNSYYPATASVAAGAKSISVGAARAGGGAAIAAGDMLLVIQVQDATINSTNSSSYGDGVAGDPATGNTGLRSSGLYEYVRATGPVVAGAVPISGANAGGLVNDYHAVATTANQTQQKFQVVRVPQYSAASISNGLTAANWDGNTGGVLALDVAGTLNLNAATLSMQGLGFRGGAGRQLNGDAARSNTDYTAPAPTTAFAGDPQAGAHGSKGGGIAGTPRCTFDPVTLTTVDNGIDALPNGSFARGAPGNAGGGGTDGAVNINEENSGGGGGANGGGGGHGGHTWRSNLDIGGFGGSSVPGGVARLFLGGGGGAGSKNNDTGDLQASAGNGGGGAVLLRVGAVSGAGTINASGEVAYNNTLNDGGGGGGAGGSIVVAAPPGVPLTGLTIHADGGRGGDTWNAQAAGAFPGNRHGPGGGGGGGVIVTSSAPTAQTVLAGANGITTVANDAYGATPGAAGTTATATLASTPGASPGATCLPQLTVTKATSTPSVVQTTSGSSATYTITVANASGLGDAINVSIADTLPAGFTYSATSAVTLSGGATRPTVTNPAGGAAVPAWSSFTIPGGGQVQVTFSAAIAAGVALGTYQNPARATYSDPTRAVAGGTITSQYTPGAGTPDNVTLVAPDMTIVKTHPGTFVRGSPASYSLVATNSGSAATSGTVTVTDTLPAGLTPTAAAGSGWTCPAPAGQNISCTRNDVLPTGQSYPAITISVNVLQGAPATVTNTATVAGGGEINTANDTATDGPATVTSSADIAITKTVSAPNANVATNVTFTITATNNGPSNATGVQVGDLLPAGLTFVSATPSQGTYTSGTGTWNIGAINNGQAPTLQLVATVATPGAHTNTATKSAETEPDPTPGNDSASAAVNGLQADIAVAKTVDNAAPNVGTNVTFTVTATNNGPSAATGVVVTDLLPAGLTFVSATPSQGTYASGTGAWAVGALANGASATLQVVATVATPGNKTNTATRTAGNQPDPTPGNDSASASVNGQQADIGVTKIVDNATPNVGTNVTFTVTATNNGPSAATGVVVTDLLPAGLKFVSSTPSQGAYNSGTGAWAIGAVANGGSVTLQLVATVATPGNKTNTATRTAGNQPDPTPGNDSASASVNGQQADIGVTKIVDNATPNVGTNVTFTVTATNNGPSNATGVVVTDLLPAGLTFVSATPSQGTYTSGTGAWNIGAIANGAATTLLLVATVTQPGTLTNTATRTAGNQADNVAANDSASASVNGQLADIAVTKTVSNPTPNVGTNVTFTITATNNGPSGATGVVVTDVLPVGLTFVSAAQSQGSYASGTGAWTIGAIANGAVKTLSVVATVTTPGLKTNTATRTAGDQPDGTPANDSASASVTGQQADIAITKTVNNAAPNVGTNVTFTVTAANNGPSAATGVVVADPLPAGLVFVSATPSQGAYNNVTGTWTVGGLANGVSATLQVVATVATPGNKTNTATRTGADQPDPTPGNDSASASVNGQQADIAVTKIVNSASPNVGTNVIFTVTATNNGPSAATGVVVTDLLPAGLTFVSATPSQGSYASGTGAWVVGGLA
ncbi:MAG: hypothetical protein QOK05_23, partial [Chloroflexota bacterium]|nr:hypothetical protein [Chloroflexota bacterium]